MSRPPRLQNFSYIGRHQYFLTFCTHERRPLLADRDVVGAAREQLLQSSQARGVAVDAYCFMPDHVHLLVKGLSPTSDAHRFVSEFKRQTGWEFRRTRRQRLWRTSYHDRILRDDGDALDFLTYIVNNPVRAGLVASPEDYEFWGSLTHSRQEILRRIGRRASSLEQ